MRTLADFPNFRPAPDGERFIAVGERQDDAEETGYHVLMIENWSEEFRDPARR